MATQYLPRSLSRRKKGIFLVTAAATLLASAFVTNPTAAGSTAAVKPAGAAIISGTLLDASGEPSTGFVKVTVDPPGLTSFKKGHHYRQDLVAWQKVDSGGSFAFTSDDLNAEPRVRRELDTLATANGGYLNFDVIGATPDGTGLSSVPRQLLASGGIVANKSEGGQSTVTITTRSQSSASAEELQSLYAKVMEGGASPNVYCGEQSVVSTTYPLMRVGITHRWDGGHASWHYGNVSDSTFDSAFRPGLGSWSISGSVHIGNSTGFDARVYQNWVSRGDIYRSKYQAKNIMFWAYGNPIYICGYQWKNTEWIGGLVNGPHLTHTIDGRCNTVDPQFNFPEGAGAVNYRVVHAEKIGGSVQLGPVSIGGSTGLTGNIGWHYTLAYAESVCGASGHVNPMQAPDVAVGPRYTG